MKSAIILLITGAGMFSGSFCFGQDKTGVMPDWYREPETPPGMVLVEGGAFDLSGTRPHLYDTISPYYISTTEETNRQYREYLKFIGNCYSPSTYRKALPDTTVWLTTSLRDSIKNFLLHNYFRNDQYSDFPVVGLSPGQIINYMNWKTDRINEMILIREGLLDFEYYPKDSTDIFSTDSYLAGSWSTANEKKMALMDPNGGERRIRMEDGIFLPHLQLVTEKQWELAARAIGDEAHHYIVTPGEPGNWKHFDKLNYFGWLYVKKKNSGKNPLCFCPVPGLHEVYYGTPNNYGIYNIDENVAELVVTDSGQYREAGHSWKAPGNGYAAVYIKGDLWNYYDCPIPFPDSPEYKVSAVSGFRLATSHPDFFAKNVKKRRAKRN